MSMFNDDQRDYMDYLGRIPPAEKCWCGWDRLGKCSTPVNCNTSHAGKTRADYLAAACDECRVLPPIHRIGCSNDASATEEQPIQHGRDEQADRHHADDEPAHLAVGRVGLFRFVGRHDGSPGALSDCHPRPVTLWTQAGMSLPSAWG